MLRFVFFSLNIFIASTFTQFLLCNIAVFQTYPVFFFCFSKVKSNVQNKLMKRNDPENRKLVDSCWHKHSKIQKHSIMFFYPKAISLLTAFNLIFQHYSFAFETKNSYSKIQSDWVEFKAFIWLMTCLFFIPVFGKRMENAFCKIRRIVCFYFNARYTAQYSTSFISWKLSNYKRMRFKSKHNDPLFMHLNVHLVNALALALLFLPVYVFMLCYEFICCNISYKFMILHFNECSFTRAFAK